jgi:hypothetical protein
MRRLFVSVAVLVACLPLTTSRVGAVSDPSFAGRISGVELCEQEVCGAAVFTGLFGGQIDFRPAVGLFVGAINHAPLPTIPGEGAAIVGGFWQIRTLRRVLTGTVLDGTIVYEGNDTFAVLLTLTPDFGDGTATFLGTLDHRVFPPRVAGRILQ